MRSSLWIVLIAAAVVGCAGHDRIVLLPDQEGRTGSVSVKTSQGMTVLDQPYRAADIASSGKLETRNVEPAEVQNQFGQALAALPMRPVSYTLYFLGDKDELTEESKLVLEKVRTDLLSRAALEIVVIGHTDRIGKEDYNDALSLKRAAAIRDSLVKAGIDISRIEIAGRGWREPLIPTDDGVAEPRNRRVEINVR
jgi:outer membrane protein OmpA-like peptidoglycan-associated protein